MSRTRYRFDEGPQPHFLTCTVVGWLPVFTRPEATEIILDSWRFLQTNGRLKLFGYVILENHLHLIAAAADLSQEIRDFKSFTARRLIDLLETHKASMILEQLKWHKAGYKQQSRYQFWQEGSHPQVILNEDMLRQKLEYIHFNPVKRGYVDEPMHWRYSSARNYAGLPGLVDVVTDW
jgi:REP element-mobilizing transposase RayT